MKTALTLTIAATFAAFAFAQENTLSDGLKKLDRNGDGKITREEIPKLFDAIDTNKDGVYSKEELAPLAKINVESLKDFDYFTFVHFEGEDDKLLKLKPPVDYWIDYDTSVLTLHFTLPLEKPVDPHGKPVAVDVYDPSFFVAFGFATEKPVTLAGTDTKACTADVTLPDADTAADTKALTESFFSQLGPNSNFGSQFAQTVTVKCKDSHL